MATIQYRFIFSRLSCTCPHPWAGPHSRLQRLDLIIQVVLHLVLILLCHSSASLPARPVHEVEQEPVRDQKGLFGPDGNWLSKRARQNEAGSNAVASPVQMQKFDGLTGTRLQAILVVPMMRKAGELLRGIASITERLWICTKLLKNIHARHRVYDSGLRMVEDHVGKPQDLYLWCSVGGSKNWGLLGCPMRFTSGCPCAIRITETRNYLILPVSWSP